MLLAWLACLVSVGMLCYEMSCGLGIQGNAGFDAVAAGFQPCRPEALIPRAFSLIPLAVVGLVRCLEWSLVKAGEYCRLLYVCIQSSRTSYGLQDLVWWPGAPTIKFQFGRQIKFPVESGPTSPSHTTGLLLFCVMLFKANILNPTPATS